MKPGSNRMILKRLKAKAKESPKDSIWRLEGSVLKKDRTATPKFRSLKSGFLGPQNNQVTLRIVPSDKMVQRMQDNEANTLWPKLNAFSHR